MNDLLDHLSAESFVVIDWLSWSGSIPNTQSKILTGLKSFKRMMNMQMNMVTSTKIKTKRFLNISIQNRSIYPKELTFWPLWSLSEVNRIDHQRHLRQCKGFIEWSCSSGLVSWVLFCLIWCLFHKSWVLLSSHLANTYIRLNWTNPKSFKIH